MFHYIFGWASIAMQYFVGTWNSFSKAVLIVVVLVAILKTFFFMRIFTMLSPIIKRILFVINKIQPFMMFFGALILFFSAIFNVISRNE